MQKNHAMARAVLHFWGRQTMVGRAMERLHILDGYGYIYRAHYGLAMGGKNRTGVRLSTAKGMPTGALYVYASMLIRLHLDIKPERIVVVFDAPGKTFRDDLDADYKKTRSETPEDLLVQMPYFRPLTELFAWPVIAVPGVEADDVIATLTDRARAQDWDVVIYTGDKDMMQLVDERVTCVDSMRNRNYDIAGVTEKFGVPPSLVGDWLALVGDKIDNVPGMPGVGKVTATKLLNQYGSIAGILEHADEIKGKMGERFRDDENRAQVGLSRQLVGLKRDVEVAAALDELVAGEWQTEKMTEMFNELEFGVLLERLGGRGAREAVQPEPEAEALLPSVIYTDVESVDQFVAAARKAGGFGLDVHGDGARHDRELPAGIGLHVEGQPPAYVPLRHRYLGMPKQLALSALDSLREALEDPGLPIATHDSKRVTKLLARDGISVRGVRDDTMVGAYLIDSSSDAYLLEKIAKSSLGLDISSDAHVMGKGKSKTAFESVEVEAAARLVGHRAAASALAARRFEGRLERIGMASLYRDLEMPLADLLARMEVVGIHIDTDYLRVLGDEVGGAISEIERRVHQVTGEQINLGSPKQLATLLFDKLGLRAERMKKTKTGYSTDHETLESMRGTHELIDPILEHRELTKLKGTYIDALPPLVNPKTKRLHTSFRQAVAATGRLSSQEPNLQNIPVRSDLGRRIRRAFVAAPGKSLISADYSQIELRVLAHLSGDPVLTAAFAAGTDVHTQTAAEVFGKTLDAVTDEDRRIAKAVNYGLAYGQSDFGLSRALDISVAEAKMTIERYFERFASVSGFMERVIAEARTRGHVETILGRRRPIPDLASRNFRLRSAAERIAQNTPIQGSAADIMKLAMLAVDKLLASESWDAVMLLTVHDELVLEVDSAIAVEVGSKVAKAMEGAFELKVPLVVDTGIASNWSEAH